MFDVRAIVASAVLGLSQALVFGPGGSSGIIRLWSFGDCRLLFAVYLELGDWKLEIEDHTPFPSARARRTRFCSLMVAPVLLALEARHGDALNEILLGKEEDGQYGQDANHSASHHQRPLAPILVLKEAQADSQRKLIKLGDVDQRIQQIIPGPHEGENS